MSKNTTRAVNETESALPHRLLTPSELAEILGVPVATLYAWRYQSKGPPAIRIGRHLRYPADGLRSWIKERGTGERRA